MDINRAPHIAKRLQSPEGLANEAWHFANTLAAGRWGRDEVQGVEISRMITEAVGEVIERSDRDIEPIYNELTIAFSALKHQVDTDKGVFMVPKYSITCATSQNIDKEEIPLNVLNEILNDAETEDHPLKDIFDESKEESSENLSTESREFIIDSLDDMEIQRTQSVDYTISHEGEIEDYRVDYEYKLDETIVHEISYIDSQSQVIWYPIRLADDTVLERRPIMLLTLDELRLKQATQNIDSSIEQFMLNQDLLELSELAALPAEERIRQVLATISLISSGFIDLRKR